MNFNVTVVVIAVVILIALLSYIGYAIQQNKKNLNYPPATSQCPDYWTATLNNICENTNNLGTCTTKDFSDPIYQGDAGNCEKSKWAQNCGIVWDGITNNPFACNLNI